MAQYINKDALVAKIEKLKAEALQKKNQCKRSGLEKIMYQIGAYNKILSFIDILEVEDIDLKREIEDWIKTGPHTSYPWCTIPDAIRITAEHFFELGLKAYKKE